METKLVEFIRQVETLADIRNGDARNPVAVDYDIPGLSMRFRVAGSISEPTFQAYPINLIWVVLDAQSPYYRLTLQLRSHESNDESVAGRITDVEFLGTWVEVESYDDLFLLPQYYMGNIGGGGAGPKGDPGKDGYVIVGDWNMYRQYFNDEVVQYDGSSWSAFVRDEEDVNIGNEPGFDSPYWQLVAQKGDTPEIDYDRIINAVVDALQRRPTALVFITAPASLYENRSGAFKVGLRYSDGSVVEVSPADCRFEVNNMLLEVDNDRSLFIASAVTIDSFSTVTATYLSDDSLTANVEVRILNKEPTQLVVTGPATVREKESANYIATVTYNDGTSLVVTAQLSAVFSVTPAAGSMGQHGLFNAAEVSANTPGVVSCTYMEEGISVTGQRNITVTNVAVIPNARWGAYQRVTDMGVYNSEFINDVLTNVIEPAGLTHTFNAPLGANEYGYYAHAKSLGTPRFEDLDAQGFYGGWDGARNNILNPSMYGGYEVLATVNGVTEPWMIYRTDHANLGNTRWSITPQSQQ